MNETSAAKNADFRNLYVKNLLVGSTEATLRDLVWNATFMFMFIVFYFIFNFVK